MTHLRQKFFPLMAFAAFFVFINAPAQAHSWEFRPYVGVDAAFWNVNWGDEEGISGKQVFPQSMEGLVLNYGIDLHRYINIEFSYGHAFEETKQNANGTTQDASIKLSSYSVDLQGTFPIDDQNSFSLVALFGVQYLDVDMDTNFTTVGFTNYRGDNSEVRARIGLGAHWQMTSHLGLRFMSKLHDANLNGLAKGLNTYQLGIVYYM